MTDQPQTPDSGHEWLPGGGQPTRVSQIPEQPTKVSEIPDAGAGEPAPLESEPAEGQGGAVGGEPAALDAEPVAVEGEPAAPALGAEPVAVESQPELDRAATQALPATGGIPPVSEPGPTPAGFGPSASEPSEPSSSSFASSLPSGAGDRPEVLIGAAFGGGLLLALILKRLAK